MICLQCYDGNFLENGLCFYCGDGCENCSSDNTCLNCSKGYFLQDGICVRCSEKSCQACQDENTCVECVGGRFKTVNDTFNCSGTCPTSCNRCSDENTCLECRDGFYLNNGQCGKCSDKCVKCVNESVCVKCNVGTTLVEGLCMECGKGCWTCSSCRRCSEGFELVGDGSCQAGMMLSEEMLSSIVLKEGEKKIVVQENILELRKSTKKGKRNEFAMQGDAW